MSALATLGSASMSCLAWLMNSLVGASGFSPPTLSPCWAFCARPIFRARSDVFETAISQIRRKVDWVFIATGWLHAAGRQPEKTYRSLDAEHLLWSYRVNAVGPGTIRTHMTEAAQTDTAARRRIHVVDRSGALRAGVDAMIAILEECDYDLSTYKTERRYQI